MLNLAPKNTPLFAWHRKVSKKTKMSFLWWSKDGSFFQDKCPTGYSDWNVDSKVCYKVIDVKMRWEEAKNRCSNEEGGSLIKFESDDDADIFASKLKAQFPTRLPYYVWTDLNKKPSGSKPCSIHSF